ncbi:MAG: hypothetical protein HKN76_06135 [Saprospiraceae bacterium]|nr:hypothetical protein [Saprospiraceae bacterium]
MKHLLIYSLLTTMSVFVMWACCKDHDDDIPHCHQTAVILGADFRDCVCCGGWFIRYQGDTVRATLPAEFVATFSMEDLPLTVFLEIRDVDQPCLGDEVEVLCVRAVSD